MSSTGHYQIRKLVGHALQGKGLRDSLLQDCICIVYEFRHARVPTRLVQLIDADI